MGEPRKKNILRIRKRKAKLVKNARLKKAQEKKILGAEKSTNITQVETNLDAAAVPTSYKFCKRRSDEKLQKRIDVQNKIASSIEYLQLWKNDRYVFFKICISFFHCYKVYIFFSHYAHSDSTIF